MKHTAILFLFLATLLAAYGQRTPGEDFPLKFSPNYRIYPSKVNQTEVFITQSPLDQNTLFVSCNTLTFVPFFISEGVYVTTDQGNTWRGNDTCTGSPIGYHGGDVGITIDKNGTFLLTRLGRAPFVGLYSHYSTDKGLTWSPQQVVSTDDLERAALTSDVLPSSPWYGRSYAAWVKFALPFPLMFAYTDDAGQHWSTPKAINNPTDRSAGGDITTGLGGKLYVCWAGVTDVSPFKEIHVGFASSANGGSDWTVTENAFPMSGISGVLANKSNIRVNSLPTLAIDTTSGPHRGWIYIVATQKGLSPAGSDPDIIINRSTDGGLTWSAGIRVNQDPLNNGKTQYFPSIHVDRFGTVNIIFYDDRHTTTDSTGVFMARSTDGGDTWHEYEISDHNFKPAPIGGLGQGYQGDIIDITSTDSKLWSVWMDNSSGNYQVWTVPITFSEVGTNDLPAMSGSRVKITPNPANRDAEVQIKSPGTANCRILVTDSFGRMVSEATLEQGANSCHFNCENWPAGIYLVRVVFPGGAATTGKFAVYHD